MNTSHWPYNRLSSTVDRRPEWDQADLPLVITPFILASLTQEDCERLTRARFLKAFLSLDAEGQKLVRDKAEGTTPVATTTELVPVEVMAIASRMLEVESARATIPVESILQTMLTSIETGLMHGMPISAKDKIDMMKFLVNKILPDAKSMDVDERGSKADRKSRKVGSLSRDELSKLSREDLLAKIAEDERSTQ